MELYSDPYLNPARLRHDTQPVWTFAYVDESGTSERWFAVGMLVHGSGISKADDIHLNDHIRSLKLEAGIQLRGDVCWKKTPKNPGRYLDYYLRCIDEFFQDPMLSFHAIVVDTHRHPLDSRTFFRGSKDAGIDAFAFHLLRARVLRGLHCEHHLHIRFDRRCRPDDATVARITTRLRSEADDSIQITARSITGGRHPLIQVADLLVGAITACQNQRTTSSGKLQIISRVREHLGHDPAEPTPPGKCKFNVWYFSPRS